MNNKVRYPTAHKTTNRASFFFIALFFVIGLAIFLSGCSPAPETKPTIEFHSAKNVETITFEAEQRNSVVDDTIVFVTRVNPNDPETIVFLWWYAGVYKNWNIVMEPGIVYPAIKVSGLNNEGAYAVLQKYNELQYVVLGYTRNLTVAEEVDPSLAQTAP